MDRQMSCALQGESGVWNALGATTEADTPQEAARRPRYTPNMHRNSFKVEVRALPCRLGAVDGSRRDSVIGAVASIGAL